MNKFKPGDKVVILSKTAGCTANASIVYHESRGKEYSYVTRLSKMENHYSVSNNPEGGGDLFHERDLVLYVEKVEKKVVVKPTSVTAIHRILPYSQNVVVSDTKGNVLDTPISLNPGEEYKVIYSGNTTVVIMKDGSKGVSKCDPKDSYNPQIGLQIAYNRAKIESLIKSTKELVKNL
jgi:hypothetical protein